MTAEPKFEELLERWQRAKRACDDLSERYLWGTMTTPVPAVPEPQSSLTEAALQHIAETRAAEAAAWEALADYLGRHNGR